MVPRAETIFLISRQARKNGITGTANGVLAHSSNNLVQSESEKAPGVVSEDKVRGTKDGCWLCNGSVDDADTFDSDIGGNGQRRLCNGCVTVM